MLELRGDTKFPPYFGDSLSDQCCRLMASTFQLLLAVIMYVCKCLTLAAQFLRTACAQCPSLVMFSAAVLLGAMIGKGM